jgi:toxin-antitoxin system PIN domain toxin
MRSYLADINFWVALVLDSHTGHVTARDFFDSLSRDQLWFCRFSQIGFLRMLTNGSVMGRQILTQQKAWQLYDRLCGDERIQYLVEPLTLDSRFRRLAQGRLPAHKAWSDAYLAAVAGEAGMALATFDRDFSRLAVETHFLS